MSTIRVRIAVAVSPEGHWSCSGYNGADDNDIRDNAIEFVPDTDDDGSGFRVTFIEADVPLPLVQPSETMKGTVTQ